MCFGCSKEPSHRDDSFEYPQHMFQLKIKNDFQLCTIIWSPGDGLANSINAYRTAHHSDI